MTHELTDADVPRRSTPSRRPIRRLRRWARHTPNGEIALTMLVAGAVLLVIALVLAVIVL